jgi:hypothetical protein
MTMDVEQTSEYLSDSRWRWAVWLDGSDEELDAVESVEWTLHPTFSPPVQVRDNRAARFRLEAIGWGEFEINARARLSDGTEQHHRHWLKLESPQEGGYAEPKPAPQTVMVSAAAADAEWSTAIQRALAAEGYEVMATDDLVEPGKPWAATIESAIDKADIVLGVFSDATSPWVERELQHARSADLPIVPIAVGQSPQVPSWLQETQALTVAEQTEVGPAIKELTKSYSPF